MSFRGNFVLSTIYYLQFPYVYMHKHTYFVWLTVTLRAGYGVKTGYVSGFYLFFCKHLLCCPKGRMLSYTNAFLKSLRHIKSSAEYQFMRNRVLKLWGSQKKPRRTDGHCQVQLTRYGAHNLDAPLRHCLNNYFLLRNRYTKLAGGS